jgi:membrane protein implicated in regulation of membrane protease activity
MCHLILLMPIAGLVVFWLFPLPIAAPIYAVILAASLILYRAVMQAMRCPVKTGKRGMIGEVGTVISSSNGESLIRVHGELWRATSPRPLHKRELVRVVAVTGLSLQVQGVNKSS